MEPKLVEFKTSDGLNLPGLLYEAKGSKKVVVYLHGNGSSSVFYDQKESRDLPEKLMSRGISILKFNNRGAHLIKRFNIVKGKTEKRVNYGTSFELIKDCVLDIDAAVSFLKKLGYKEFYLAGKSTGANKICVYDHEKPENIFKKYALISGGDDTGIYYSILKDNFWNLLKEAENKIAAGFGEKIFPELLNYDLIFSYKGFYDIANPDGDYNCFPYLEVLENIRLSQKPLFRYFAGIKKPSLVVYGEHDEASWKNAGKVIGILKKYQPGFTYEIIKNADHRFTGKRKELAKIITDWISRS